MMNHICTWFCADEVGEESIYHQTGEVSSSLNHQKIYWRCIITFFATSIRVNKKSNHILFTNVRELPVIEGKRFGDILKDLNVAIIHTDFKYKTPKGYYSAWRNQFYEFSILEYISKSYNSEDDNYLILDSDCIFLKSVDALFIEAEKAGGFMSYEMEYTEDHEINGISRIGMKKVYEELLQKELLEVPAYFAGEFLLCSVKNIIKLHSDFSELWPILIRRNEKHLIKFNEEAHTLSYLYYKNGFQNKAGNKYIRRIWTNPVFYRNVKPTDVNLYIWHLPAEKKFGIEKLFKYLMKTDIKSFSESYDETFTSTLHDILNIPRLGFLNKLRYYSKSYYSASKKRFKIG
jgi:hypothetical protein